MLRYALQRALTSAGLSDRLACSGFAEVDTGLSHAVRTYWRAERGGCGVPT